MYLRIYTLIVCLLLIGLLHTSTAQPLTKGQIKADQKNIVKDKQAVADDRRDLDRLSDLVLRWDTLRKESPNFLLFIFFRANYLPLYSNPIYQFQEIFKNFYISEH